MGLAQCGSVESRALAHARLGLEPAAYLYVFLIGRSNFDGSVQGISQSFTVPSLLPDASRVPSGLKATDHTIPVCPLRMAFFWPVFTSHTLIFGSSHPAASRVPSGLNA